MLLDALLALLLLALTFGLVAGIISFGHRVLNAGAVRDRLLHVADGTNALESWLASASALRPRIEEKHGPVQFEGRPDRMSFVTLHTGDALPAGLLAVSVGFSGGRNGSLLFDAQPMALGELQMPDMTARQVLVSHVAAVRFHYFGSLTEGVPPGWYEEWTSAKSLPLLIALHLDLDLGHRTEPIDLAFRTRAQ